MAREQEIVFPTPSFDQAVIASQNLWLVYGLVEIDCEESEKNLDNQEAARRMEGMAVGIMNGTITSHLDIARGIKNLGFRIGPLGGIAMEIDLASFKLTQAIREKLGNLTNIEILETNPLL